jgi:cytochrome c-type biogenesis protein
VCVIPLYPGFLSFLSRRTSVQTAVRTSPIKLGLFVTLGVVVFMTAIGLIFSTLLRVSLTNVVRLVSPIAFVILGVVSLFLIFNVNLGRFFPKITAPTSRSPLATAFLFGFFFGAIIIPCNPGLIAAFFAKTIATSTLDFFTNILHFLLYAIGIAFPLLVFSFLSAARSQLIIRFMVRHSTIINRVAGLIMLGVSLYYLIFVFRVFS